MKFQAVTAGGSVVMNTDELQQLRAMLEREGNLRAKVGVLGSKDARMEPGLSNAVIGLTHEFGSVSHRIPARSFLRMPLLQFLPDAVNAIGEKFWIGLLQKKGLRFGLGYFGQMAKDIIMDAFATGGFGLWKRLSRQTIQRKKSSAILIDTAQLRKSVDYEIYKPKP